MTVLAAGIFVPRDFSICHDVGRAIGIDVCDLQVISTSVRGDRELAPRRVLVPVNIVVLIAAGDVQIAVAVEIAKVVTQGSLVLVDRNLSEWSGRISELWNRMGKLKKYADDGQQKQNRPGSY